MRDPEETRTATVGVLYPGELGSTLGGILASEGFRVIAAVEGRGPRTHRLCQEAGLETVGSLDDVARLADVVLSVVPPSAALPVAEEYLAAGRRQERPRLYVDVNSVSPDTVARIGGLFAGSPVEFVDAAVHGVAARLRTKGVVYLSGPQAPRVAAMFGSSVRVRVVGDAPGQASALKSVLAGMSKGLAALFFEAGVLAREAGLFRELLEECAVFYPGVLEAVDRTAPSYPLHAGRRCDEMRELEHTMESLGLAPRMVRAARQVIGAAAASGWADAPGWTTAGVVEELHRRGAFRAAPPIAGGMTGSTPHQQERSS